MSVRVIKYKIEGESSDFTKYVFDFILKTTGFVGRETSSDQADIYYGNKKRSQNSRIIIKKDESDTVWQELIRGDVNICHADGIIPFDIINAIGFFLDDRGNQNLPKECYDMHSRLIFEKSLQYTLNIADFPIIDVYITFLKSLFERLFPTSGLPMWPNGRVCAIGLSHDVDIPCKYRILRPFFERKGKLRHRLFSGVRKVNTIRKYLMDKNRDGFWLFEDIINKEREFGFKSTFFFAALGPSSDGGSCYDADYKTDSRKFVKVFKEIAARGFEIGLHASYNAYLEPSHFPIQKHKLTKVSGLEVKGIRHHYWHMGRNVERTLEMHEKSGFEYDSSIAFNQEMGFRRNVAFPYYPWSQATGRPIGVIQLPVFLMDGNLFYRTVRVDDAVEKIRSYIETIKRYGSMGVIDWHVRTSYPKNTEYWDWGAAYIKTMEYLSADPKIWVTNLGDISSWLKQREGILST